MQEGDELVMVMVRVGLGLCQIRGLTCPSKLSTRFIRLLLLGLKLMARPIHRVSWAYPSIPTRPELFYNQLKFFLIKYFSLLNYIIPLENNYCI
jgi:hypothetical protein